MCLLGFDYDHGFLQKGNWEPIFEWINFVYNKSKSPSIGCSPFYAMFLQESHDISGLDWNTIKDNKDYESGSQKFKDYIKMMEKVREVAYHTINETKNQYNKMLKQRYDQNKDNIEFKKGDFVLLFVGNRNVGNKRKFSRKWIGPFIITKKESNHIYFIGAPDGYGKQVKVHMSQIRFWLEPIKWTVIYKKLKKSLKRIDLEGKAGV